MVSLPLHGKLVSQFAVFFFFITDSNIFKQEREYKIVIIGSGGVGKSALSVQMTNKKFLNGYDPTIEDIYSKKALIHRPGCEPTQVNISILDTAGQLEYIGLRENYIKNGEGFILVYDITSRASFNEAVAIHANIRKFKGQSPCILVGNKIDIVQMNPSLREVSVEEGYSMAQLMGPNTMFAEISTMINVLVQDVFRQLLRLMQNYSREIPGEMQPVPNGSLVSSKPLASNRKDSIKNAATQAINIFTRPIISNKPSKSSMTLNHESRVTAKKSSSSLASIFGSKGCDIRIQRSRALSTGHVLSAHPITCADKTQEQFGMSAPVRQLRHYHSQLLPSATSVPPCISRPLYNGKSLPSKPISPSLFLPKYQENNSFASCFNEEKIHGRHNSIPSTQESQQTNNSKDETKVLNFFKSFRKTSAPSLKPLQPVEVASSSASESSNLYYTSLFSNDKTSSFKTDISDSSIDWKISDDHSNTKNALENDYSLEKCFDINHNDDANPSEPSKNVFKKTFKIIKHHLPRKSNNENDDDLLLSPLGAIDNALTPPTFCLYKGPNPASTIPVAYPKSQNCLRNKGSCHTKEIVSRTHKEQSCNVGIWTPTAIHEHRQKYNTAEDRYIYEKTQYKNPLANLKKNNYYGNSGVTKNVQIKRSDLYPHDASVNKERRFFDYSELTSGSSNVPVIDSHDQQRQYRPLETPQTRIYYPPISMECI